MQTFKEKVEWRLEFLKEHRKRYKGNNNYTRELDAQIKVLTDLLTGE